GQWLERLGQPFVTENRPGAGNNVAIEAVVRAPADGHTLLLVGPASATNAALYDKLNFNFIRDITPIVCIFRTPLVIVLNPSVPVQTLPDLTPMPWPIRAESTWRRPASAVRPS
ncbi:MAG: tripartite tricarboxylate transporter substrate-binding protein, partial [Pseudolabrys sp.]